MNVALVLMAFLIPTEGAALLSNGGGSVASVSYSTRASIGPAAAGVATSAGFVNSSFYATALCGVGPGGSSILTDSFTAPNGIVPGWTVLSGSWAIRANALEHQSFAAGREAILAPAPPVAVAWFEVTVRVPGGTPRVSIVFRSQSALLDGADRYWVELDYASKEVRFLKSSGGVESVVASSSAPLAPEVSFALRIKAAGGEFRVLLDGAQVLYATDSSIPAAGFTGLEVESGSLAIFDDFRILAAGNTAPVAQAGPDQEWAGSRIVTLDGSGSVDEDGDPLRYAWVQIGGPPVTLTNDQSVVAAFSGVEGNTYTFGLTVDDFLNPSAPDVVTVTIASAVEESGGSVGGKCGLLGGELLLLWILIPRRSCERSRRRERRCW